MRAIHDGTVVAESDDTVVVEGNHYFPRSALREELFRPSDKRTTCAWKGEASYLSLDGAPHVAWFYPEPKDAAADLRDRVAFWGAVRVTD